MNDKTKFAISALGIFFSYFYFGILQEQITRGRYGDELNEDGTRGEKFTFILALVGIQCLWNWIFAKGIILVNPQKEDQTHAGFYASSALTYVLAMLSSNLALRWVPYPTQVIGKSAKPIPVMLLGVLVGRKSYALQRYFFVLLIVVGVVLFMMKEGHVSKTSDDNVGLGEILLILSLSMDGFTGAIQERMRAASAPSAQHMMLSMNAWSTIFVSVGIVASGELFEFIHFAGKYPQVWIQLAILALTGSLGQYFIFMMVSAFGPLACSVVTTTRKFFTVLCSVLFLGNPLTSRQWLGTAIVFAGLFADACFGKSAPKKKSAKGSKSENEKLIS